MKKSIVTLMMVVMSSTGLFGQTVKPEITKVIVYYDSALVKKEAKVNLSKGENLISIDGLPASMVNESVQVVVKGAVLHDVAVQTTYLKKAMHSGLTYSRKNLNRLTMKLMQSKMRYRL